MPAEAAVNLESTFPRQTAIRIGEIALGPEVLGVNDPLTHLDQYARHGNAALPGIREDLDTLVLEMLPDPFKNTVDFRYQDGDFISVKDGVSLKKITATNAQVLTEEARRNSTLSEELLRARTEAREPYAVEEWFCRVPVGSLLIAESLPIGAQEFAVARLHLKAGESSMREFILALHNPSVEAFNELRAGLGAAGPPARTAMELLAAPYEVELPAGLAADDFIERYVDAYDSVLQRQKPSSSRYAYGVAGLERGKVKANSEKVRQGNQIKEIYLDTLKAFHASGGRATDEIIKIAASLRLERQFHAGQRLDTDDVRETMRGVIQAIVSTFDGAEGPVLAALGRPESEADVYASVGDYGAGARMAGRVYDSACPTIDRAGDNNEQAALTRGYNLLAGGLFADFGTAKIGVCRTGNCLSRGFDKNPKKTIVGGCDFCKDCHVMLKFKKNPEAEHGKRRRKLMAKKTAETKNKPTKKNT